MDKIQDLDSPFTRQLIEYVTICYDKECALWSVEDQRNALTWIWRELGRDWRSDVLCDKFGTAAIGRMKEVVAQRMTFLQTAQEIMETDSRKDTCHLCSARPPVTSIDFAVAKKLNTTRDWSSTVASVALSAVTLPLFGMGHLQGPGKQVSYRTLRLHLMLCQKCRDERRGMFRSIKLGHEDFARHPAVNQASRIGYNIILTPQELDQLRHA